MNIKKFVAITLTVAMVVTASACGGLPTDKEESSYDPSAPIASPTEGMYIRTESNVYYAPNTQGHMFSNTVNFADPRRLIIDTNNYKFIPELYANDNIVYFTSGAIPQTFNVEEFRDTGYTVGLKGLVLGTDGYYKITKDNLVSNTSAAAELTQYTSKNSAISIMSINDQPLTPDMITEAGTIKGFNQGDVLKIGYLLGTYYGECNITCDLRLWYSSAITEINSYYTTKNGYIIIELPEGFNDEGYISIAGTGLIHVVPDKERQIANANPEATDTTETDEDQGDK